MNEKFPELLLIRRSNANVSWAAAEAHCFEHTHKRAVDRKASKAADKEEKDIASSHQVNLLGHFHASWQSVESVLILLL